MTVPSGLAAAASAPEVNTVPAGAPVTGTREQWEPRALRGPWEHPALRAVAGAALRPGGVALTMRALELARQLAMLPHDALVVDLGCGPGETVALLHEGGMAAVGLDISAGLLAEARARNGRMPLIRADAGPDAGASTVSVGTSGSAAANASANASGGGVGLPLRTASLDGAFCECVLSVLPGRQGVLAELARVLRPGGVLVWTDLYLRPGRAADAWHGEGENGGKGGGMGAHVLSCRAGAMPRANMEAMLRRAGFTVLAFEDHSRLLAELAGRLLFAGAELAELFGCGGGGGGRPGYALLLARRDDAAPRGNAP